MTTEELEKDFEQFVIKNCKGSFYDIDQLFRKWMFEKLAVLMTRSEEAEAAHETMLQLKETIEKLPERKVSDLDAALAECKKWRLSEEELKDLLE
jgi:hypothetical protein